MQDTSDNLTKGSLLTRNILFSLIGQSIPIFVAIYSIPILINALGPDGFGVLTIAWMVTGYFSLLDLGIGRALTKMLSEKLGRNETKNIPDLIWTALILTFLMGLIGSILIRLISPILVNQVFKIPLILIQEVTISFYVLALSIPLVIITASLRAILESYQRFDLINIVRAPIGSLTFIAPLLVLPFTNKLFYIVSSLVLVRLFECLVNLFFCIKTVPNLLNKINIKKEYIGKFLRFGGWMTISNIIGPLMLYIDRFLIGALLSVAAVAYYATSYEIVNRLMFIPGAIVGVLFPAFGALIGVNTSKAKTILFNGVKYTFICIFPIVLIVYIFAEEGLNLWLGADFANQGTIVLKLLVLGALINSFAYFPFAVIHASGRPDLTAKLHMIETPIYMIIAALFIISFGIKGAAIAWLIRIILDTLILFYLSGRLLNISFPKLKIIFVITKIMIIFYSSSFLPNAFYFKLAFIVNILIITFFYFWLSVLTSEEKNKIINILRDGKKNKIA